MRIIAGELKGRRLACGDHLRPTGDRVRGALFSILGGTLDGSFVDAFAGTGAVGLEARSRGARVVLVERDPQSLALVERNVASAGDPDGVVIVAADAQRFFKDPAGSRRAPLPAWALEPASVIFADPPYDYPLLEKLLRTVARSPLRGRGTLVVLEHRRGALRAAEAEDLVLRRREAYGETELSFFGSAEPSDEPRSS